MFEPSKICFLFWHSRTPSSKCTIASSKLLLHEKNYYILNDLTYLNSEQSLSPYSKLSHVQSPSLQYK
jgi:hypothetical protein